MVTRPGNQIVASSPLSLDKFAAFQIWGNVLGLFELAKYLDKCQWRLGQRQNANNFQLFLSKITNQLNEYLSHLIELWGPSHEKLAIREN